MPFINIDIVVAYIWTYSHSVLTKKVEQNFRANSYPKGFTVQAKLDSCPCHNHEASLKEFYTSLKSGEIL